MLAKLFDLNHSKFGYAKFFSYLMAGTNCWSKWKPFGRIFLGLLETNQNPQFWKQLTRVKAFWPFLLYDC